MAGHIVVYGVRRHTEAVPFLKACAEAQMLPDVMLIDERRRAIAVSGDDQLLLRDPGKRMALEWVRDARMWSPKLLRDLSCRLEFARLDPSSVKVCVRLVSAPAKQGSAAS